MVFFFLMNLTNLNITAAFLYLLVGLIDVKFKVFSSGSVIGIKPRKRILQLILEAFLICIGSVFLYLKTMLVAMIMNFFTLTSLIEALKT